MSEPAAPAATLLPYESPHAAAAGIAYVRAAAMAAVASGLIGAVHFALRLSIWTERGLSTYTAHWLNALTLYVAIGEGVAATAVTITGCACWLRRGLGRSALVWSILAWAVTIALSFIALAVRRARYYYNGTGGPALSQAAVILTAASHTTVMLCLTLLIAWLARRGARSL